MTKVQFRRACVALALVAGCGRVSCGGGHDEAHALVRGPFPEHRLPGTEIRRMPRTAAGRAYQLHIALPASFDEDPMRHYPVIYLCDAYWDFPLVQALAGALVHDKAIPEVIIVGLGYPGENPNYGRLRRWDLTPVPAKVEGAEIDGGTGHAGEFLLFIANEVMPLVEREYRGDPSYRVLMGSSLGGLFTLYAMFAHPEHFAAYIATSPVAEWADDWLLDFEAAYHKGGRPLGVRLFASAAEKEFPPILEGAKRFDARMRERTYAGLAYRFRLIEGERHAGTKAESYNRGLSYVFAPLAPDPLE